MMPSEEGKVVSYMQDCETQLFEQSCVFSCEYRITDRYGILCLFDLSMKKKKSEHHCIRRAHTMFRLLQPSNKNASCMRASLDVHGLPSPRQSTRTRLGQSFVELPITEAEDRSQAIFNRSSKIRK